MPRAASDAVASEAGVKKALLFFGLVVAAAAFLILVGVFWKISHFPCDRDHEGISRAETAPVTGFVETCRCRGTVCGWEDGR